MKTAREIRVNIDEQLQRMPCRELTDQCAPNGDCLRCSAVQGETCREPVIVAYRPEGNHGGR